MVNKEMTRALLTLKDANLLTKKERTKLADWLRSTAKFLTSKEVTEAGLSKRFTARYIQSWK